MACLPLEPTDPICGFLGPALSTFQSSGSSTSSAVIPTFTGPEGFFCPSIPQDGLKMIYCMASLGPCYGQSWRLPADWNLVGISQFYQNANLGNAALVDSIVSGGGLPMCYDTCHAALTQLQGCWAMEAIFVGSHDICLGLPASNCAKSPGILASLPSPTVTPNGASAVSASANSEPTTFPNNGGGSGSNAGNLGGNSGGSTGGNSGGPISIVVPAGTGSPGVTPALNTTTGLAHGNATCPVCADCRTAGCTNFGVCSGTGKCVCPLGFGGPDCSEPLCNSPLAANEVRSVRGANAQCKCDAGFTGPNCNICQNDQACSATGSGSSLSAVKSNVCNTSPKAWVAQSAMCSATTDALQTIYNGSSSISFIRNITSGVALATFWYNGNEQFMCQMTNCSQILYPNVPSGYSYEYSCSATSCLCNRNAEFCTGKNALTSQITTASGLFDLKCKGADESSSGGVACTTRFNFLNTLFPNGITLPSCVFGECADPSANPFLALENAGPKPLGPAEIAGIATVSIVGGLVIAALSWAYAAQLRAQKKSKPPPLTGLSLSFHNVSYSIDTPSKKQILHSVSGSAPAGKVLAILGPSGAGKSTFLDILGGKPKIGHVSGALQMDGVDVSQEQISNVVAYVDQNDLLMPILTVRETLMFAARLRLPESMSRSEKETRVEEVLDALGLLHIADTRVGGFGQRGISGGERRRVSIGIQLVTSPAVILLDEPTSGLDSHAAHSLVKNLSQLAHKQGKTVVLTIHQPRSDIFNLFDNLVVLSKGQPLYVGSGGHGVAEYFVNAGSPCPEDYNMADHLLDVAADHELSVSIIKECKVVHRETPATSDQRAALMQRLKLQGEFQVGFMTVFGVLLGRCAKNLVRTPSLLFAHLVLATVMGLFIGGAYYQSGVSLLGIQNRMGSVLFILSLIGFSSLSAIGSFSKERELFMRERSNGMYGSLPYYLAKIIFDIIPLRLIPGSIIGIMTFFMIGYTNTDGALGKFLTLILVFSAEMGLLCLTLGIAISEVGTATLSGAILILFKMLFAGFLINQDSIPKALIWIQYLSFFKYPFEGLVINDLAKITIVDSFDNADINIPATLIIEKFGLNINHYTQDVLISVALLVVLVLLNGALIHYRLREKR